MRMDAETAQKIKAAAAGYLEAETEMLRRLCTIDCGTGSLEGNAKVIAILSEFFESIGVGYETVEADGLGYHFVARTVPPSPKGKIILNAHIDTVFQPGDTGRNPFYIDDEGWIHGCGVADCKGGVVISAHAVRICKELGLLPDYEIVLIYNCDEERGSPSGKKLFEKEAQNATCCFAFEPARDDDGIITSRMGHGSATVEVFGKQAHPARYTEGASATECLIRMLNTLYERSAGRRNIYFNVANFVSGPEGILSPHASAHISFRINDDNPFEHSRALLEEVFSDIPVKGCSAKYQISEHFPAMKRCPGNIALYRHMSGLGREYLGWELPEQSTGGSGDACYFSSFGVPSVCGLGTYLYTVHTLEEKCKLSSITPRTQLMALTLAAFDEDMLR